MKFSRPYNHYFRFLYFPVVPCPVLSFPVMWSPFLSSFRTYPPPHPPPVSCLPTDLISDNLQCLNDGDVSQLLGNAKGRLSILQKKIYSIKYSEISETCREALVWGSGSPLLKSRIRILPFLISIRTIQILTRPKYAEFLIVGLHEGLSS